MAAVMTPNIESSIQTPIHTITSFKALNFGKKRGSIFPNQIDKLLSNLITICKSILEQIEDIDYEEAKRLHNSLKPLLGDFVLALDDFNELKHSGNYTFDLLRELIDITTSIIGNIIYISNGKKVNETTSEYNNFFLNLIEKTRSQEEIVYGKSKVLALFMD